jgi:ferredoxin
MTVSRKTLTITETFFQQEVKLDIDVKRSSDLTLLDIFNANKISINQSCGGSGSCGTCRVEVDQKSKFILPLSEYENEVAVDLKLSPQQRLSCQAKINIDSIETNLFIKIVNEVIS